MFLTKLNEKIDPDSTKNQIIEMNSEINSLLSEIIDKNKKSRSINFMKYKPSESFNNDEETDSNNVSNMSDSETNSSTNSSMKTNGSTRKRKLESNKKPGTVIWAALNKTYWAAVLIGSEYELCGVPPPRPGYSWVFWYSDNRVSEVPLVKIEDFEIKYDEYIKNPNRNLKWKKGVLMALKELAVQYGFNVDNWSDDTYYEWASNEFNPPEYPLEKTSTDKFSSHVLKHLNNIREVQEDNIDVDELNDEQIKLQEDIKNKKICISEICLRCFSKNTVDVHPLFVGRLCKNCREKIKTTMYAFGADGIAYYCAICGRAGELLCCDLVSCGKGYCTICLETFCTKGAAVLILKSHWKCFACNIYDSKINGYLVRRDNWSYEVKRLYVRDNINSIEYILPEVKSGIRVLSLFDGIATGYIVLNKLNIKIDQYYASEIEEKCMSVVRINHGNNIIQLGDIRAIDENVIEHILPIDLILAASPCNDLSLANPQRKGIFDFTGTGVLFFEFFRILNIIQKKTTDRTLFWLFENVASMTSDTKDTINRFLGSEPVLIDAKSYSSQKRPRYFWGNIPALDSLQSFDDSDSPVLNNNLTENSFRSATVDKIRTVTTNLHSLRQATNEYPVYDVYGNGGTIWITELEDIFGFPKHYTDVANFSCHQRHELLGKAWSVPVVSRIIKPLTHYFKQNLDEESEK